MTKYAQIMMVLVGVCTLELRGDIGVMVVEDGARLEGTGSITADVTFSNDSTFVVNVAANDPLDVIGALDLGGATLDLGTPTLSGYHKLITSDSLDGTFKDLADAALVQTGYYIHYWNDGEDSQVFINANPAPTSSGIDLRAYQGADGVYVEFIAFDVESDGEISLALLDGQGEVVWQGAVSAVAGPEFVARFKVPGLFLGQSYNFKVRDEVGTWWSAMGVAVGGFNAEMVSMTLAGATIAFDSIAGREYEVQWTATLSGEWQTINTVVAEGPITSVEVAFPEPGQSAGFFRTRMR